MCFAHSFGFMLYALQIVVEVTMDMAENATSIVKLKKNGWKKVSSGEGGRTSYSKSHKKINSVSYMKVNQEHIEELFKSKARVGMVWLN